MPLRIRSFQLHPARKLDKLVSIELSVPSILNPRTRRAEIENISGQTEKALMIGRDAIVFTSRRLVTGTSDEENVHIGQRVSDALPAAPSAIFTTPAAVSR